MTPTATPVALETVQLETVIGGSQLSREVSGTSVVGTFIGADVGLCCGLFSDRPLFLGVLMGGGAVAGAAIGAHHAYTKYRSQQRDGQTVSPRGPDDRSP